MTKHIYVFIILFVISAPLTSAAEYLNLSRDANGWTVFSPSADSDVIYIDSVSGDDSACRSYRTSDSEMGGDPFNPAGAVIPCETITKAWTLTGESQPDWFLFKRGSTFDARMELSRQKGRSATEPRVFASYGASGDMPIFRGGLATDGNDNAEYLAVSGLDLYRDINDPDSPNYAPEETSSSGISLFSHVTYHHKGILIEGCKIRWFQDNILGGVLGDGTSSGITIRRNVVHDSSSRSGGHSQGVIVSGVDGFLFEENILDHNGWRMQNDGDGQEDVGEATQFNHNLYSTGNQNSTIKNNIFMRPSSINAKNANYSLTTPVAGLVIENNLFVDGEIAISIGASDQSMLDGHTTPTVTGNIFTHGGNSNATNREFTEFFYNYNVNHGSFTNNLMIHQENATINGVFLYNGFNHNGSSYSGNIVYNCLNTRGFESKYDGGGSAQMTGSFNNNKIDATGEVFYFPDVADISGFSFSGNKYNSTKAANTWFNINGSMLTNAQWVTLTGDNSTFEAATYPDPTRDVDTYMQSLGETATIDAFIAKCRMQDRYSWDTRYTADAVNNYIRAGFGVGEYTPPGQARRLSLAGRPIKLAEPGP